MPVTQLRCAIIWGDILVLGSKTEGLSASPTGYECFEGAKEREKQIDGENYMLSMGIWKNILLLGSVE